MSTTHMAAVSVGGLVASGPLGFLIGLSLGTLGGGGSILAVPALVYGVGEAAHEATTTSLVAVGVTALVGMAGHLRAGRVRLGSGLAFGLVGIGGSLLGSPLSRTIPDNSLMLAFSALILVAAWRMHARHTETPCHTKQLAGVGAGRDRDQPATGTGGTAAAAAGQKRSWAASSVRVVIAGSIVGLLTGFFGVGGGFVIVPALVLALGGVIPNDWLLLAFSEVTLLAAWRIPARRTETPCDTEQLATVATEGDRSIWQRPSSTEKPRRVGRN